MYIPRLCGVYTYVYIYGQSLCMRHFFTVFLAIQVSITLSLGDTRWGVLAFWIGALYMFYAAHWQTYSTGFLKFGEYVALPLLNQDTYNLLVLLQV